VISTLTPHITIGADVKLLANAVNSGGTTFTAGDVTLEAAASQISLNVPLLSSLGVDSQTANIEVKENVAIRGKDVTLKASAEDVNPLDAINKAMDGHPEVAGLVKTALGAVTDLLSLPISVQVKCPSAAVTVGANSQIVSAGQTEITSTATADATGEAIFALG